MANLEGFIANQIGDLAEVIMHKGVSGIEFIPNDGVEVNVAIDAVFAAVIANNESALTAAAAKFAKIIRL